MSGNDFIKKSLIPAYIFSFVIFIVASLPGNELERIQRSPETKWFQIALSDPFMHFIVFGVLAMLICRGFYRESRGMIQLLKIALLAVGYGFFIEAYQGLLPWRSFGLDDLFWNMAGVISFLLLVRVFKEGWGFRG